MDSSDAAFAEYKAKREAAWAREEAQSGERKDFSAKSMPTLVAHYDVLGAYVARIGSRVTETQKKHLDFVRQHRFARMSGTEDEAQFIALLCNLAGFTRVIEVGTFLGYTTLVLGESLPPSARIVTLDFSREWVDVARAAWVEAGVAGKIEARIGSASSSLADLLRENGPGSFDVIFLDADKVNYDAYYELGLQLIRQGGAVLIDNTLWHGKVAHETAPGDLDTEALKRLNDKVHADPRVDISLVPFADGLTICRKR